MTRSMTVDKQKKISSDIMFIIESHRRDGCTNDGWDPIYHNWNCFGDDDNSKGDDEDTYQQPCRCCIAQLFRKGGRSNPCNVACRVCYNWKGEHKSFTRTS